MAQHAQNFLDFLVGIGCIILIMVALAAFVYLLIHTIRHPPQSETSIFEFLDPLFRISMTAIISAAIGAFLAHLLFNKFVSGNLLYALIAIFAGLGAVIGVRLWRKLRVGDSEV